MNRLLLVFIALCVSSCAALVSRSSHSEAPFTAQKPSADISDVYAFVSYEDGRSDYITHIVNAIPLQFPGGGPNYFSLSDEHYYQMHWDVNGDCVEDFTLRFMYGNRLGGSNISNFTIVDNDDCTATEASQVITTKNTYRGLALEVGPDGAKEMIEVALKIIGTLSDSQTDIDNNLNWIQYYSIEGIVGAQDSNTSTTFNLTNADAGGIQFDIPMDYAGEKTFADYATYAEDHITGLDFGSFCNEDGRVFVGQRAESFHIALGRVFDLVNMAPIDGVGTAQCIEFCDICDKNVASFIVEIHKDCLFNNTNLVSTGNNTVMGFWATTRRLFHDQFGGHFPGLQTSRLGNPLVNELIIGLRDKSLFTVSPPSDDGQFAKYVTHPTLPEILEQLFSDDGAVAPNNFPRLDLVVAFLQGIPGLNQPTVGLGTCEMLRLNVNIAPTARSAQNFLGVIGNDTAGFPNGRRPGDDTVDIALRAMMGVLCTITGSDTLFSCNSTDAPAGGVAFSDGVPINAEYFGETFPYLNTPNPGAVLRDAGADLTCPTTSSTDNDDGDRAARYSYF